MSGPGSRCLPLLAFFRAWFLPLLAGFVSALVVESSTGSFCLLLGRGLESGSSDLRLDCTSLGFFSTVFKRWSICWICARRSVTTFASSSATSSTLIGTLEPPTWMALDSRRMGESFCEARLVLNLFSRGQSFTRWSRTFRVGPPCQQKEHLACSITEPSVISVPTFFFSSVVTWVGCEESKPSVRTTRRYHLPGIGTPSLESCKERKK